MLKIIALGSSTVGRKQIVDVPFPFVQEELVESEAPERVLRRTVSGHRLAIGTGPGRRIGHCHQKHLFLQVVRKELGRPRADSAPSIWKREHVNECTVEVPVPLFREETVEVRSTDQILDVPVVEEPVFKIFPPRTVWNKFSMFPCRR